MTDDKTEPLLVDVTDNPISHVRSRVVPGRVARPRESIDPHLSQARRTCAALVASAANPPLRLQAEFELVGIGRLRTTALENFSLQDHQELADGSFTLSFEYRGREPLVHICASEAVYKALRRRLYDHALDVKSVSSATASKLTIEPLVAASVSFDIDRARDMARITLRNVVMLGSTIYDVPLARLDRNLIDAVVDLITSQSRTFYTLVVGATQNRNRG